MSNDVTFHAPKCTLVDGTSFTHLWLDAMKSGERNVPLVYLFACQVMG